MRHSTIFFVVFLLLLLGCHSPEDQLRKLLVSEKQIKKMMHSPSQWALRDTVWQLKMGNALDQFEANMAHIDTKVLTASLLQKKNQSSKSLEQFKHYYQISTHHPLAYDPAPTIRQLLKDKKSKEAALLIKNIPQSLINARQVLKNHIDPKLNLQSLDRFIDTQQYLSLNLPQALPNIKSEDQKAALKAWIEFTAWCNSKSAKRIREKALIQQ